MNVATPKKQANIFFSSPHPPPKKIHERQQLELFYTRRLGFVRMFSLSLSVKLKEGGCKGSVQSLGGLDKHEPKPPAPS